MRYTEEQKKAIKKFEAHMNMSYLTEHSLGDFLNAIYPNCEWVHDKRFQIVEGEAFKFRPDFCCHELKMCVEFDGADHYMKTNIIQADNKKDETLKSLGYKVIRIPYFVQLDSASIKYLFNLDVKFDYHFKHGFISRNVTLPSSFCELGIWKFKNFVTLLEMDKHGNGQVIFDQIRESIINRIKSSTLPVEKAILNVLPSSLINTFSIRERNYSTKANLHMISSNLRTSWNTVILESSESIRDLDGVYDLNYTYNMNGDISGYSFKILYNNEIHEKALVIERSIRDHDNFTVEIKVYKNRQLSFNKKLNATSVNLFSLSDMVLADLNYHT